MKVNQSRIMQRIEACAKFTDSPEAGVSRFSYSQTDAAARDWLIQLCEALGLQVTTDAIGNIRARYAGTDTSLAPVLLGSHVDSVRNGGKYDGVVGVVGALEAITVMKENGYQPRRSVELIAFAEEEGSNFGTTMVGSKTLVGKLSYDDLAQLKAGDGRSCLQIVEEFGLNPRDMDRYVLHPGDIDSMVELHVEQGIVLERENLQLGVVQAIAGMTTLEVTVCGVSNHAGATPMNMRNDPMTAAGELITNIEQIAAHQALPTTVATVGAIACAPNMPNVIPRQVTFTVDIRDIDSEGIRMTIEKIEAAAQRISAERGVAICRDTIGASAPITLSPRVIKTIERAVCSCSPSWRPMNSGAVHDAAMMAAITDVGMIFIPSADGKSHNDQEYTKDEDIALGCQALLQTAIELSA